MQLDDGLADTLDSSAHPMTKPVLKPLPPLRVSIRMMPP